jgi:hypothetical protein
LGSKGPKPEATVSVLKTKDEGQKPPTQILNLRSFYVIPETPCLDWRECSRKQDLP